MSILIDTTGSMDDSIDAVKAYAQDMVLKAKDEDVFYITPFNDPEYGPVMKFTDPQKVVEIFRKNALPPFSTQCERFRITRMSTYSRMLRARIPS